MTTGQSSNGPSIRRRDVINVVKNAIGPEKEYAMGYMNPMGENPFNSKGTGYIATMKLSIGKVDVGDLDEGTESIVSYDLCETADANIGQINMITASSFCGLNGALWGHDLVEKDLKRTEIKELSEIVPGLPVYSADPLLDATELLFGHVKKEEYRHPPLPGAHVVCANKNATFRGPTYAWAFIAIAIAKDFDPEKDPRAYSNLFIEDTGKFGMDVGPERFMKDHSKNVIKSIELCGQDYNPDPGLKYKEVFIGGKAIYAGPNEVACALACAPYVLLAQNDVPKDKSPKDLIGMSITDGEDSWNNLVWKNNPLTPTSALDENGIHVQGPNVIG